MKNTIKVLVALFFMVIGTNVFGQDYSYYDKFYVTVGTTPIEVRLDCLEYTSGITASQGHAEIIENAFSEAPTYRAYIKGTNTRYYGDLSISYHIDVQEFINGNISDITTAHFTADMYAGELSIDPFNIYIHYTNNISYSTWFIIDNVSSL